MWEVRNPMACSLVFFHTFVCKVRKEESKVNLQVDAITLQLSYRVTFDNTVFALFMYKTLMYFFSNLTNWQRLAEEGKNVHIANSAAKSFLGL